MYDIVFPVGNLSISFDFLGRVIVTVDIEARVVCEVSELDLIEMLQEHVIC